MNQSHGEDKEISEQELKMGVPVEAGELKVYTA
jgi:hypothetical protein